MPITLPRQPLKALAAAPLAALLLAGCTTAGWDGAHGHHHGATAVYGYGVSAAPWWGRNAPSVQVFYSLLAPYGQWTVHPGFGRVFVPSVGSGWRPYTVGHWVEDRRWGQMWRSTEPFGWATSHYGRWGYDSRIGWFWVPDTVFGPHWVQWRGGAQTIGWAALPPRGWERWGVGYHPYSWSNWWVFAPSAYFWSPTLYRHLHPPHRRYWEGTRVVTQPGRDLVGRALLERTRNQLPPAAQAPEPQQPQAGRTRWQDLTPAEREARREAWRQANPEAAGQWQQRRDRWQSMPEEQRAAAREAARARWQERNPGADPAAAAAARNERREAWRQANPEAAARWQARREAGGRPAAPPPAAAAPQTAAPQAVTPPQARWQRPEGAARGQGRWGAGVGDSAAAPRPERPQGQPRGWSRPQAAAPAAVPAAAAAPAAVAAQPAARPMPQARAPRAERPAPSQMRAPSAPRDGGSTYSEP